MVILGPLDSDVFIDYIKTISPITNESIQGPKRITILPKRESSGKDRSAPNNLTSRIDFNSLHWFIMILYCCVKM